MAESGRASRRPTPRVEPDTVTALRTDLLAARFTVDGVAERLGQVVTRALHRDRGAALRRMLRGVRDPLATLMACWTLGDAVAAADLDTALPRTGTAGLMRLGLVGATAGNPGGHVRARYDLRPYAVAHGCETVDAWVCSDWGEAVAGGPLPADHVPGVGGASVTLASWTPRERIRRALDLGTGSGVQALALAGHADRVVATDVDDRALAFAAFTAAISGQTWDLRRGDLFEPVAGERFDLVVANPPFVITPRTPDVPRYRYRDGGRAGDELVAHLVRRVADHLERGGVAQFLGNWEIPAGTDDWSGRPKAWLAGTGLDAWVVQRESADPAEYAHTWIRDGGHEPGTAAYERLMTAWLDDFERRDVAAVGFGIITLQRPADGARGGRAPYTVFEEVASAVAQPTGPAVAAGLAARCWLADHPGDAVLDHAWRCAPDVLEERYAAPGAPDPAVIRLTQGGGLRRTVRLDTVGAAVVSVCDGSMTAGRALAAVCALLEQEPSAARPALVDLLRTLVADGMLVPADPPYPPSPR